MEQYNQLFCDRGYGGLKFCVVSLFTLVNAISPRRLTSFEQEEFSHNTWEI